MANLNLGQDVANKTKIKQTGAHLVDKIVFPIASSRNVSLRVSYKNQPLCWQSNIKLLQLANLY